MLFGKSRFSKLAPEFIITRSAPGIVINGVITTRKNGLRWMGRYCCKPYKWIYNFTSTWWLCAHLVVWRLGSFKRRMFMGLCVMCAFFLVGNSASVCGCLIYVYLALKPLCCISSPISKIRPPKNNNNMILEHGPLEQEIHIGKHHFCDLSSFSVSCGSLFSRGVGPAVYASRSF